MKITKTLQLLSNDTRLAILAWLKNPKDYFKAYGYAEHSESIDSDDSVCVGLIQRKSKLSQSTVSQYMSQLESSGLVSATRHGKWTHYKRNEKNIKKFIAALSKQLG